MPSAISPKTKAFVLTASVALALDFATKASVLSRLAYGDRHEVIEGFFYITHVRNPGAAFSMFADAPENIRLFFFVGISLLALAIIFSFFRQLAPGERFPAFALGSILGGAAGNLVDRVFRGGEVVDFLHFRLWSGYSWPDFNLADTFIVVGVALLILELLVTEGEDRTGGAETDTPPA
ncbi:MAG: signal peptidase II [Deltaproteobacteria bacterium]|nr:signal peptidase II [Deltaproteobacteria bacterium]MBW2446823.1 signal peptidase II [Deltaproteobacteria bacterium]